MRPDLNAANLPVAHRFQHSLTSRAPSIRCSITVRFPCSPFRGLDNLVSLKTAASGTMQELIKWIPPWMPVMLLLWFLYWTIEAVQAVVGSGGVGGDAVIYHRAAVAWSEGGNPWEAFILSVDGQYTFHFYALPPTVILLQPFTVLPETWVPLFGVATQVVAAVYVIRRLRLPVWWLLFPPLASGVASGNPSVALLALLLASHPVVNAVAPVLKVYAGLPLLGERRWMAIGVGLVFLMASLIFWPDLWALFFDGAVAREAQLMDEAAGGFSAYKYGILPAVAAAGLLLVFAVLDRRASGWLAPIAIWPASQFHWSTLGLPLRSPLLAAMLAPHVQGGPPVAVVLYIVWASRRQIRSATLVMIRRGRGRMAEEEGDK